MPEFLTITVVIELVLIGLTAGVLGGLLGVGGSVIMIPGLVMVFGYRGTAGLNQHVYQAAAMIANVAVSVPAALRHRRAGALRVHVIRWMLPAAVVCVLIGVWLSNTPVFEGPGGGIWLGRILAMFMIYVIVVNVRKVIAVAGRQPQTGSEAARHGQAASAQLERADQPQTVTHPSPDQVASKAHWQASPSPSASRAGAVGAAMGVIAGLLGVGGGAIAVPLQQALLRLPLRSCIANSSLVICFSATIGAIYKNITLSQHAVSQTAESAANVGAQSASPSWVASVILAAVLAPLAFVGGRIGAGLTHTLPIRAVRVIFILLMVVAAWKLAALT